MRKASRPYSSFPRTWSAATLVISWLLLLQGCNICVWLPGPGTIGVTRKWYITKGPLAFSNEQPIGAILVPSDTNLIGLDVIINNTTLPIDMNVSPADQTMLLNELISRNLFNPQSQAVVFFRTTAPITISPNDTGEWRIYFSGSPFSNGSIIAAGTTASDLANGFPLTNFKVFEDKLSGAEIPLLNVRGLVVFVILLGAAGLTAVRRRSSRGHQARGAGARIA